MEKFEFNYIMTINLIKELEKKGVYRNQSVFSADFYMFSVEELSQIETLVLENVNDLTHLEKFSNLKKVIIQSVEYTRLGPEIDLYNSGYTNSITDFSPLENCTNLEELVIINDTYIQSLDVSKLKRLKNIKLINIPNFTTLIGLETLKQLESVMIYGTSINSDFDIVQYIENTKDVDVNILDVNMYQSLVRKDEKLARYITQCVNHGQTNIKFAELVGLMQYAILEARELEEMYRRASLIFRIFGVTSETTTEDKIKFVYEAISNSTKFDQEGIKKRNEEYNSYIEKYQKIPDFAKNRLAMLHSSYNALMIGKSNCEGFINAMKFLLNILGIRSFNVHCIDLRNNINNLPNHALIRILYNGIWKYCDPTIMLSDPFHFFMRTYDELVDEGCHRLNAFEKHVNETTKIDEVEKNGQNNGHNFRKHF